MRRNHSTLWVLAILFATASLPMTAMGAEVGEETADGAKSAIFLIGDGMGYAQLTAARWEKAGGDQPGYQPTLDNYQTTRLYMDGMEYAGHISTHSLDAWITDSAAAVTAMATGQKTYNDVISVGNITAHGEIMGRDNATLYAVPLKTILEMADEAGKATGVVSTSRITHATPAGYYAHVAFRDWEDEIAEQCIESDMEVAMGGGASKFSFDNRSLLEEAPSLGWTVVRNGRELSAVDPASTDRLLGIFTDSHMSYELDRDSAAEPSLAEMTEKAIEILSRDDDGFFLMVEGARIDHAGHARDYKRAVGDTLAFDEAVKVALDYAAENPETLVVVTADHECGGLVLGANSSEYIEGWAPNFGSGAYPVSDSYADLQILEEASHTATDVPIFASGPGAIEFSRGLIDNTEVFEILEAAMGL
jgi:alkaline phosphatase